MTIEADGVRCDSSISTKINGRGVNLESTQNGFTATPSIDGEHASTDRFINGAVIIDGFGKAYKAVSRNYDETAVREAALEKAVADEGHIPEGPATGGGYGQPYKKATALDKAMRRMFNV